MRENIKRFNKKLVILKYLVEFIFFILLIGVSAIGFIDFYLIITGVVVVTEDGIHDYSFYNLKGTRYEFSEVKYVETGFKNKGRSKGEFFYNIKMEDGKIIKLAHPSSGQSSDRYIYDTWQEYVDIDKYIMKNGAEKESSEKGVEYVLMEQVYIDKLLEVVRNK